MSYLLDTHALLWWLFNDPRLSATAKGLVMDRGNTIYVSSASAWEIATKHRLGKLASAAPLLLNMRGSFEQAGFRELPITVAHAQQAGSWPQAHRDPFDRMLAAQAKLEDIPLISRDPMFGPFGVRLLW